MLIGVQGRHKPQSPSSFATGMHTSRSLKTFSAGIPEAANSSYDFVWQQLAVSAESRKFPLFCASKNTILVFWPARTFPLSLLSPTINVMNESMNGCWSQLSMEQYFIRSCYLTFAFHLYLYAQTINIISILTNFI